MRLGGIVCGFIGLVASGCATVGEPLSKTVVGPISAAGPQVAFDHGCPSERIRLIRRDDVTADLDVCGVVRRYKIVASGLGGPPNYTWLDVTNSYPPGALPAPLPPIQAKPAG